MGFAELLAAGDRALRQKLGGPIVYTPSTGEPVTVNGIFDLVHVQIDAGGKAGVSTSGPAAFLTVAELPSDPFLDDGATVTVDGVTYTQRDAQPDGLGGVILLLNEA